ncbi:hypothetical protein PLCT1_01917 [Planctomycetaceae bacterium]|nr:hypothetical protein PLCT1_01917 [Planctomycetaceae bacterium]
MSAPIPGAMRPRRCALFQCSAGIVVREARICIGLMPAMVSLEDRELVLGRRDLRDLRSQWPYEKADPVAQTVNTARKRVAARTLRTREMRRMASTPMGSSFEARRRTNTAASLVLGRSCRR